MIAGKVTLQWKGNAYKKKARAARDTALKATAAYYVERVRASFTLRARGVPSAPGTPPSVQTGDLRRRLFHMLKRPGVAIAGSNLRYARIQELGGTIHAKRTRNLAIPLTPEARRLSSAGNIRSLNLDWMPTKRRGGGLLGRRRGKQFDALFVLKPSVRLPPRPYLVPMLRKAFKDMQVVFSRSFAGAMK